ncbi:protein kinase [Dactylosporangium sp. NPDC006015]|uniref:protein kinase domain-containing protein n=1 Tax=Dactylosporangium sp. NPDC006015 TaxID=3154576 RepID=UPI0033B3F68C
MLETLAGHPNIIRLRAAAAPGAATMWLASDLCEESLAARLRRGDVPVEEAFAIADDLLAGLGAIHGSGHLHRDIEPENVLLDGGRAKLCDLGVTAAVAAHTEHNLAGTGPYLAPELAAGQPTVRSDIYAAALVIDALFAPHDLERVNALLTRASSARPVDRPVDVAAFRAALAGSRQPVPPADPQRPAQGVGPRTAVPAAAGRRPAPARRRRTATLATAGVAVLAAGAAAWWLNSPTRDAAPDSAATNPASGVVVASSAATASPAPSPSATASPTPSVGVSPLPTLISASTIQGTITVPSPPRPGPATGKPVSSNDGDGCYATAVDGGFNVAANEVVARGPNFTSAACRDIHIRLTSAPARTYARSCTETPDGATVTGCSAWMALPGGGAWVTLSTAVPADSRWQLQMQAESAGELAFQYTG